MAAKKEKEEKKVMDRLAKEAKKEKGQPEEKGISTVKGALDRIKSRPLAKAALKELVEAGFDQTTIVQIVLSYCGGTEERVKTGLAVAKKFAKELDDLWRQLMKDADRVERITEDMEKYHCPIHVKGQQRGELVDNMRKFADVLSEAAKLQSANMRDIRIGGKVRRDRKTKKIGRSKLRIMAGRDQSLVYLVYFINGQEKPTAQVYARIAPLVAAVIGKSEDYCSLIADDLRNSVTRFEEKNPILCYFLAVEAWKALESRHAQHPTAPPRT